MAWHNSPCKRNAMSSPRIFTVCCKGKRSMPGSLDRNARDWRYGKKATRCWPLSCAVCTSSKWLPKPPSLNNSHQSMASFSSGVWMRGTNFGSSECRRVNMSVICETGHDEAESCTSPRTKNVEKNIITNMLSCLLHVLKMGTKTKDRTTGRRLHVCRVYNILVKSPSLYDFWPTRPANGCARVCFLFCFVCIACISTRSFILVMRNHCYRPFYLQLAVRRFFICSEPNCSAFTLSHRPDVRHHQLLLII